MTKKLYFFLRALRGWRIVSRTVIDAVFGPLENRKALKSQNILIFPQSGIGDQLISLSAYLQLAKVHKLYILLNPSILSSAESFFHHDNIQLIAAMPLEKKSGYSERKLYRQLAKDLHARILSLSDLQLRIARYGRPHENPNSIIYRILGLNPQSYESNSLRTTLKRFADSQYTIPKEDYALIDHFPGSSREIPESIFDGIKKRGLRIEFAPKNVPFPQLFELVSQAQELHLVNSSFFCFSLLVNPTIKSKSVYIVQNGYVNGRNFYDSTWREFHLIPNETLGTQLPEEIDREIEFMRELELSNRFMRRLSNFYFTRIYNM